MALPLSIVVPALNEAASLEATLESLQESRAEGAEVIVVDGGSEDGTVELARGLADRVMQAPRGRAAQMNAGARAASGAILLFLHADTILPPGGAGAAVARLAASGRAWGRFDVAIEGNDRLLSVVAWFMNHRSRLTGIATGDQAIFVRREAFERAGGYPEIPLMEDIALSRALKRLSRPLCMGERARTSGRHWERRGTLATILLMWRLRLAYFLGADPRRLAERYGGGPSAP